MGWPPHMFDQQRVGGGVFFSPLSPQVQCLQADSAEDGVPGSRFIFESVYHLSLPTFDEGHCNNSYELFVGLGLRTCKYILHKENIQQYS